MRILPLALCLPVVLGAKRTHHQHTFTPGEPLELRLYLSESPRFRGFNASEPVWVEQGIPYLVDAAERTREVQVPMTPHLLANGTLFAHAFFTRQGYSPDPSAGGTYDPWATTMLTTSLVAFAERQQPMGLKKLLTGEPAPWEEELRRGAAAAVASGSPAGEFISYWKPALHLQARVCSPPLVPYTRGEHPSAAPGGRRPRRRSLARLCGGVGWGGRGWPAERRTSPAQDRMKPCLFTRARGVFHTPPCLDTPPPCAAGGGSDAPRAGLATPPV